MILDDIGTRLTCNSLEFTSTLSDESSPCDLYDRSSIVEWSNVSEDGLFHRNLPEYTIAFKLKYDDDQSNLK